MRLLVKDRRFLPEGPLGANHNDRARRVVEHFRKRLGSVRPYRVAAGGTPRGKRSNLETDLRSQIVVGERSGVRDVDCLRVVAVDGCGHTRDLGEEPIQVVDERISDVSRCARVDLLVEAVLLRIRGKLLVGVVLIRPVAEEAPIENQIDVLGETVDQVVDLRQGCFALEH